MKRVGSNMPGEHPLRESYDRGSAGDSDRTLDAGHHGLDGFAICRRRQSCRLRSAACAGSATVRAVSAILLQPQNERYGYLWYRKYEDFAIVAG